MENNQPMVLDWENLVENELSNSQFEQHIDIPDSMGEGDIAFFEGEQGLSINHACFKLHDHLGLRYRFPEDTLMIKYLQIGNLEYRLLKPGSDIEESLFLEAGQTFIYYVKKGEVLTCFYNTSKYKYYDMVCIEDTFNQVLRGQKLGIESFESMFAGHHRYVRLPNLLKQASLLRDIENCSFSGVMKQVYIQGKSMEFFARFLEHITRQKENTKLPNKVVKQMLAAREMLLDNLRKPPSAKDLAVAISSNESYVKKYFKQVYGQTLHEAVIEARMNLAKTLLENSDCHLGEIAWQVGYPNQSHFTVAFKKYFGVLPSHWKA